MVSVKYSIGRGLCRLPALPVIIHSIVSTIAFVSSIPQTGVIYRPYRYPHNHLGLAFHYLLFLLRPLEGLPWELWVVGFVSGLFFATVPNKLVAELHEVLREEKLWWGVGSPNQGWMGIPQ